MLCGRASAQTPLGEPTALSPDALHSSQGAASLRTERGLKGRKGAKGRKESHGLKEKHLVTALLLMQINETLIRQLVRIFSALDKPILTFNSRTYLDYTNIQLLKQSKSKEGDCI